MQSGLLAIKKTTKYQKEAIGRREEDLQVSSQDWEMSEDHSSLMALHVREVTESKEQFKCVLGMRAKPLDAMKKEAFEIMQKLEEKCAKEREHSAV